MIRSFLKLASTFNVFHIQQEGEDRRKIETVVVMTRSTSANTLLTSNGKMNKGCESQVKSVK